MLVEWQLLRLEAYYSEYAKECQILISFCGLAIPLFLQFVLPLRLLFQLIFVFLKLEGQFAQSNSHQQQNSFWLLQSILMGTMRAFIFCYLIIF